MKLSLSTLGVLGIAVGGALFFAYSLYSARVSEASTYNATAIQTASSTALVSVTTSGRVLATTTSLTGTSYTRVYATICNPNATPVALLLDGDKPVNASIGGATTFIAAAAGYNACYEITDRNQYSGSVTASSTGLGSTAVGITVSQYVQ